MTLQSSTLGVQPVACAIYLLGLAVSGTESPTGHPLPIGLSIPTPENQMKRLVEGRWSSVGCSVESRMIPQSG